jgi:hypothetical protein
MKRRKVGMIPAKADPDEQENFVQQKLNPHLAIVRTVFEGAQSAG